MKPIPFKKQITLITLFIISFMSISSWATTYYVDKNNYDASDLNIGTENLPWKTIQHAVDIVGAGDTVLIKAAIYYERVDLTGTNGVEGKSGNAEEGYIIYKNYQNDKVIMEANPSWTWGTAFISGKWVPSGSERTVNYIIISGLEIYNYPEDGICFEKSSKSGSGTASHHIIIENCLVHHCGGQAGITFEGGNEDINGKGYDIIVRACTTYNNNVHGIKFTGDETGVIDGEHIYNSRIEDCVSYNNNNIGIHVSTGHYNITVRNNTCYNNGRQGIAGHEIWDSVYENNTVYENGTSGGDENEGIGIWNSKNITIRGNRIYGNPGYGLKFWEDLSSTGSSPTIENNVVLNNNEGGIGISTDVNNGKIYHNTIALNQGTGLYITASVSGHDIKNNIVCQNSNQLSPGNGNIFDYNLYYPDISFSGKGAHSISGDPLFVDPLNPTYDFHLQSISPAIDSGTNVGINEDIEGNLRPQDAGYDIGAYEYQTTGVDEQSRGKQLMFRLYQNYPNPFNPTTRITYYLPSSSYVTLTVYDLLGRAIQTLVSEFQTTGSHSVNFDCGNISSGIYFYQLKLDNEFVEIRKMILMR
jgi:hypothetical protein